MGKIIKIKNSDITKALRSTVRQYFVGNLSRPQQIEFIRDERLEIGISSYKKYQFEPTHVHNIATEYQYVINGWTEYMDVETGVIYEFKKGDFYAIESNTIYSQKVKAGTAILFIKVPSINDKKLVEISGDRLSWLYDKLQTVRTNYYYDKSSPKVNSIRPAAAVVILNSNYEILMLRRKDDNNWTMPGGTLEFGESLVDCAIRETKEETGIDIVIKDIIGIYTDPHVKIAYSDGEVRQEFTFVYYGMASNYDVHLDNESNQFIWISTNEVLDLTMSKSQKRRIVDVISYLNKGSRRLL